MIPIIVIVLYTGIAAVTAVELHKSHEPADSVWIYVICFLTGVFWLPIIVGGLLVIGLAYLILGDLDDNS